ncbi:XRE family transcriptional regulator [Cellulomonas algicola]|uniref:XRE family transcriptional regulator n=1 Tax=Cellulomonas algicola TaxID=2071633 RepID=A0A401UX50_9CELL|nr:XRE family transcriptional regulator [Cellulomonas algicola]GCD19267.1 XRE family transcriptional regulator [Cellulomonas algicola]
MNVPSADPAVLTSSADRRTLCLVREAKGWTQRELASRANVNQSTISKSENGLMELKGQALRAVADALDCPPQLLTHPAPLLGLDVSCLHHRRRSSRLTVASKNKIEAVAHLSRLSVENLLSGYHEQTVAVERVAELDPPDPVDVAADVRGRLGLAPGPVPNLVAALEHAGVVVFERPLGSSAQDAVSSWPHGSDQFPLLIVNSGLSGDRQRFTIAHELGHVVMHRIPGEDQEAQADQFAASLLAPPEQIRPALTGLTTAQFRRLVELKPVWGMSVAALVRRARDLGEISDRQYREFQLRLTSLGWKTSEPIDIPAEHPTTLRNVLARRLAAGQPVADLARTALMTESSFRRYFPIPTRCGALTAENGA